jgi:hypothetical protein
MFIYNPMVIIINILEEYGREEIEEIIISQENGKEKIENSK